MYLVSTHQVVQTNAQQILLLFHHTLLNIFKGEGCWKCENSFNKFILPIYIFTNQSIFYRFANSIWLAENPYSHILSFKNNLNSVSFRLRNLWHIVRLSTDIQMTVTCTT